MHIFEFIIQSFPIKSPTSIYPSTYEAYPTAKDVLAFIRKTGITNVDLSSSDIKQLLERLVYDGKVYKRMKSQFMNYDDQAYTPNPKKMKIESIVADDEEVIGMVGEDEGDDEGGFMMDSFDVEDAYMYIATREVEKDNAFVGIPCGKCPVFEFCSKDGPVNPQNCSYFNKWLAF